MSMEILSAFEPLSASGSGILVQPRKGSQHSQGEAVRPKGMASILSSLCTRTQIFLLQHIRIGQSRDLRCSRPAFFFLGLMRRSGWEDAGISTGGLCSCRIGPGFSRLDFRSHRILRTRWYRRRTSCSVLAFGAVA